MAGANCDNSFSTIPDNCGDRLICLQYVGSPATKISCLVRLGPGNMAEDVGHKLCKAIWYLHHLGSSMANLHLAVDMCRVLQELRDRGSEVMRRSCPVWSSLAATEVERLQRELRRVTARG